MKHIKHLYLYIFCIIMIPYVALRAIASVIILIDEWSDKIIESLIKEAKKDE